MIHLITGGSGSGKSAYAEDWLFHHREDGEAPLLYIAAMKPYGKEAEEKIARHHRLRAGKGFVTLERYTDLSNLTIPENTGVLLECISNLTANEFYREDGQEKDAEETMEVILKGIRCLLDSTGYLAVVTNEVNSDINGYLASTEKYKRLLGMVNQRIASFADQVTEVVYGIPMVVKKDEKSVE